MFYMKSWRSRLGRCLYEGRSNGRKLLRQNLIQKAHLAMLVHLQQVPPHDPLQFSFNCLLIIRCDSSNQRVINFLHRNKQRYSTILSYSSTLHGGERSVSCPANCFPKERALVPLYRSMSGPQTHNSEYGWGGEVRNLGPSWKFNTDSLTFKLLWWQYSSLLKTIILDFAHHQSF
jgi:hypothetical protein